MSELDRKVENRKSKMAFRFNEMASFGYRLISNAIESEFRFMPKWLPAAILSVNFQSAKIAKVGRIDL